MAGHHHDRPPSEPALRVKALESLLVEAGYISPAQLDASSSTTSTGSVRGMERVSSPGPGPTPSTGPDFSATPPRPSRNCAIPARRASTSSPSRTRRKFTTWSSARSVPAIRGRSSACRRPGTSRRPTGREPCANRGRFSPSSASGSPKERKCASGIQRPRSATWFCRSGPPGSEGLDEAALASLVTRDSMIGAGQPKSPSASVPAY